MALPKRRHSTARRDKRRANWYRMKPASLVACTNCRALTRKHQACPTCGYYDGQKVMKGSQERVHKGRV